MYIILIANGADAIFIPINIVLWPYGHYNLNISASLTDRQTDGGAKQQQAEHTVATHTHCLNSATNKELLCLLEFLQRSYRVVAEWRGVWSFVKESSTPAHSLLIGIL